MAKKSYIFVIFQGGGGGGVRTLSPHPHMYTAGLTVKWMLSMHLNSMCAY